MSHGQRPWMKWFPSDWRAEPGLRMCSFAARGLWADMLALMHEAEPYGHLLVNNINPSFRQLAGLLGGSEEDIAGLVSELEAAGVFSRTHDGVIISRRMLRDELKRIQDRTNGARGGNPNIMVKRGVNPPDNPPDNGGDKAHMPEARVPEPERKKDNNIPVLKGKNALRNSGVFYAFEHGCVRLTEEHLAQWREAFSHISVTGTLIAAEPWLAKQKSWFNAAAGLLDKREREATKPPLQKLAGLRRSSMTGNRG